MNRTEHLLVIMSEECDEVGQRVCKALRFGLEEIYGNHPDGKRLTNAERIREELDHLYAMEEMLQDEGLLPLTNPATVAQKRDKVEDFLRYSRLCGTLQEFHGATDALLPPSGVLP